MNGNSILQCYAVIYQCAEQKSVVPVNSQLTLHNYSGSVLCYQFSVISLKNDYSFDVSAVSLLPSSGIQNDGEMIQKCA